MGSNACREWSKVDWSKRTKDIAEELQTDPSYVSQMRRRYAPHTTKAGSSSWRQAVAKYDWDQVDWGKPTHVIAKELGTSREYVYRNRIRLAPETVSAAGRWKAVNWEDTDEQLARKHGVALSTVWIRRRQYAPYTIPKWKRKGFKHDYEALDWSVGTMDLARKLDTDPAVVSRLRKRFAPDTVHKNLSVAMKAAKSRQTGEQNA